METMENSGGQATSKESDSSSVFDPLLSWGKCPWAARCCYPSREDGHADCYMKYLNFHMCWQIQIKKLNKSSKKPSPLILAPYNSGGGSQTVSSWTKQPQNQTARHMNWKTLLFHGWGNGGSEKGKGPKQPHLELVAGPCVELGVPDLNPLFFHTVSYLEKKCRQKPNSVLPHRAFEITGLTRSSSHLRFIVLLVISITVRGLN